MTKNFQDKIDDTAAKAKVASANTANAVHEIADKLAGATAKVADKIKDVGHQVSKKLGA